MTVSAFEFADLNVQQTLPEETHSDDEQLETLSNSPLFDLKAAWLHLCRYGPCASLPDSVDVRFKQLSVQGPNVESLRKALCYERRKQLLSGSEYSYQLVPESGSMKAASLLPEALQ